jgi:hypothetical protein
MSEAYGPWGNNGSTTKAAVEGEPDNIQGVLPQNLVLTQKK